MLEMLLHQKLCKIRPAYLSGHLLKQTSLNMFLMETPTDSQIRWQNSVMWQGIRTAQEHIAHVLAAQHSCENAAVKVSIAISFKPCKCIKKVFSIKLSKHIDFILYYLSMQTDIIKIGPSQNASPKLCPATDSLTGVKCRATSVAKNWGQRRKLQF